ncbi:MAG: 3-phosphoshikimate 1-carboxyvinyltransferase [Thermoplasmata archaeon]
MSAVRISPGRVAGTIRAPPSKSYTHRALVAGHLAEHRYTVENPLDADDTRATAHALRPLGSLVRFSPRRWTVTSSPVHSRRLASIDCGESGTTLRFVAALAGRSTRPVRLRGRGRLPHRPMAELLRALKSLGATCERPSGLGELPVTVRGPLHGGAVRLRASLSSQFASALLLTLPTVPGDSSLELVGPIVSEPYIAATLAVIRYHRVRVNRRGRRFSIPGSQNYRRAGMRVPGDASSAAYFWAAGGVTGGKVRVTGVSTKWPQADLTILDLLRSAGAEVHQQSDGATVDGGNLRRFTVDLTGSPDLYPLAGVLAATIPGRSRLEGAPQVVHKESNRQLGTRLLARAMGAEVRTERGGLTIRGTAHPRGFGLRGLDDHRIVMSAGVAALAGDRPSTIEDASAVAKSYPEFWRALDSLRRRSNR